jgi:hypothetical protein
MSQTTVEEIYTAVQRLPDKERMRLSELLRREREEPELQSDEAQTDDSQPRALDQIPPTREAEMQWLLDHPDFWDQHRGEHVALWGYEMIAVGKTRKEVVNVARQRGIKFRFN